MARTDLDNLTRLLLRAQDGDTSAFTRIATLVQPELARFSSWYGIPKCDIDDVVQESLLRIYKKMGSYRAESRAISWMISITHRVCIDYSRSRTRRLRVLGAVHDNTSHLIAGQINNSVSEITDLISRLPHSLREAFILVKIIELSYQEAASILDVPIGTIQNRVSRARAALITMLNEAESHSHNSAKSNSLAG